MYVTCSFILMKLKSFSCETFCTSTQCKKEANSNSEVEVKSAYEPSGPSGLGLSLFLWHDVTRSISTTPLDRMLAHCRITPNNKFASTYLYTWVKRGSVRVKCHNTMYNVKCHNTMYNVKYHNTMFPARAGRKEIQKSNNRLFTQTA